MDGIITAKDKIEFLNAVSDIRDELKTLNKNMTELIKVWREDWIG